MKGKRRRRWWTVLWEQLNNAFRRWRDEDLE